VFLDKLDVEEIWRDVGRPFSSGISVEPRRERILFYSKSLSHTYLSNFHPCKVGKFQCLEAAYQFEKSKFVKAAEGVENLPLANGPRAKAIGNRINKKATKDELKLWNSKALPIMYNLLKEKFCPGSPLAKSLLETGDAMLVEATTDQFWGAGMEYKDLMRGTSVCFSGANKLGLLLMQVRRELSQL